MTKEEVLQMAAMAINDSIGPHLLVSLLLIFETLQPPGLFTDQTSLSIFQKVIEVHKRTEAMSQHFANQRVRDTMNARNGPYVTEIGKEPVASPVLAYCVKKNK